MPAQLHSQARMMQYIAIVASIVMFFRCLGGVLALTIMSSIVNNKLSAALSEFFPSGLNSSAINSLGLIQSLPPSVLALVQNAFSDAVRWAYIALIPFASLGVIGAVFLREVHIEKRSGGQKRQPRTEKDGQADLRHTKNRSTLTDRPRATIYGPATLIVWVFQAVAEKIGWRK